MNYKLLGSISPNILANIRLNIKSRRNLTKSFEALFPEHVEQFYRDIFPAEFRQLIEHSKVFVTSPGCSYPIHKDGYDKKCALNVAIDCDPADWVRWYNVEDILSAGGTEYLDQGKYHNGAQFYSRNVRIDNFENVPYIEEAHNQVGDVYLVNTDVYHAFKNNGTTDRLIIQTKFKDNPSIEEVYNTVLSIGINV